MEIKANPERVEIKIVMRTDTMQKLDMAAEQLKATRHAFIEMLFSRNDNIALLAFLACRSGGDNNLDIKLINAMINDKSILLEDVIKKINELLPKISAGGGKG